MNVWTATTSFRKSKRLQLLYLIINSHLEDPIRFPNFRQVRRLSFSGHFRKADFNCLFQHPIILDNPRLRTLCLSNDHDYIPGLLSLKRPIPATIFDLQLHTFSLRSIRHVLNGHLTYLDLSRSLLAIEYTWVMLLEHLSSQNIRLRGLALDHFVTSDDTRNLLAYLSSYSSLESFRFSSIEWYDDYDTHPVYFYTQVLPLHVETLVELELRPIWESYWCVGVDNIYRLRQCKRLRNLSIKVNHCGPLDPHPHPGRSSVGSFYGDKNIPDQEDMNSVVSILSLFSPTRC
ncbi:hypothetical protein EV361DRAFT_518908 [Lentinula raphanica]|nr:hypothetical protein EV361DRAFT_518908 [Lentinula raphanica]